jgi:hypothetical protein
MFLEAECFSQNTLKMDDNKLVSNVIKHFK